MHILEARNLRIIAYLFASVLFAQGVATRNIAPQPKSRPSGLPFLAQFQDVASEAGLLAPVIYGPADRKDYIVEAVGCGVAFFDYDADGLLDIFVLSGRTRGKIQQEITNRLYRNRGNGHFEDVTDRAGLHRAGWFSSVSVADFDNDGHEDLFVTAWGANVLYRNRGNGTFEDVTARAGLDATARQLWHSGATFLDYDRDGDLDLFVATYLDFSFESVPATGQKADCNWKGIPVNCGPRGLPTTGHMLWRNNGNGTFTDVSKSSGIASVSGSYGMTAMTGDYDNDGWPDIYVACDSSRSYLFHNNHDGTFTEEGLDRGVALSDDGQEQAGMGVAAGDYDGDGDLDLFKTHFADDTPVLYRNDGRGNFDDVTVRAGLGVETRFVSWGTGMQDFDNDGWPDLFVVTGNVYPEVEKKVPSYPWKGPRLLFRNLGNGRFEELIEEAGPGIAALHSSRGAAFGDYDNDGDIDVVILNMGEPPSLLRNDLPRSRRHWVRFRLQGVRSNRSAVGARLTLRYGKRVQTQEVQAQSSFYSVNDRRLHFGLGDQLPESVVATVRWPNGRVEEFRVKELDRTVVLREGTGGQPIARQALTFP